MENEPIVQAKAGIRLVEFLKKWADRLKREKPTGQAEARSIFSDGEGEAFHPGLLLLKTVPYLTLGTLVFSFSWDFSGTWIFPLEGERNLDGFLRTVSTIGLVGFITNRIAIQMLFFPRNRRPLLGQGLIPASKDRIVRQISEFVGSDIVSSDLIREELHRSGFLSKFRIELLDDLRVLSANPEFRADLAEILYGLLERAFESRRVRRVVAETVSGLSPSRGGGIGGAIIQVMLSFQNRERLSERIEAMLENVSIDPSAVYRVVEEILQTLPEKLNEESPVLEDVVGFALHHFLETIDIAGVVEANLTRFDEKRLEELFKKTTSHQLAIIQSLGCVVGILGGILLHFPLLGGSVILGGSVALLTLDRLIGGPYK